MSVATEVAPAVGIPERAGAYAVAAPGRLASVAVLAPPDTDPFAAPVRLTRRGVLVLSLAVAVLCTSLAWLAGRSAPGPAAAPDVPATVIVAPGTRCGPSPLERRRDAIRVPKWPICSAAITWPTSTSVPVRCCGCAELPGGMGGHLRGRRPHSRARSWATRRDRLLRNTAVRSTVHPYM